MKPITNPPQSPDAEQAKAIQGDLGVASDGIMN